MKKQNTQNGNALWFILIAILLLGLLTSMMTRSGSSTNDTGDYEQLSIQANEILNYAKSIENGVQSLLARGCSENEISFEANNNSGYTNPNSPADNSCHVFKPEGSGLTYIEPNEKWLDSAQSAQMEFQGWVFSGDNCVYDVGQLGVCGTIDSSNFEQMLFLPWVSLDVCLALNKSLGHNFTSSNLPQDGATFNLNHFIGAFPNSGHRIWDSLGTHYLEGVKSFCFEANAIDGFAGSENGTYHFYHVLNAR